MSVKDGLCSWCGAPVKKRNRMEVGGALLCRKRSIACTQTALPSPETTSEGPAGVPE